MGEGLGEEWGLDAIPGFLCCCCFLFVFFFFFWGGGGTCFVFVLFFGKIHKDCKEVFVGFFFLDSTFQLLIGWAEQAKLEINLSY